MLLRVVGSAMFSHISNDYVNHPGQLQTGKDLQRTLGQHGDEAAITTYLPQAQCYARGGFMAIVAQHRIFWSLQNLSGVRTLSQGLK